MFLTIRERGHPVRVGEKVYLQNLAGQAFVFFGLFCITCALVHLTTSCQAGRSVYYSRQELLQESEILEIATREHCRLHFSQLMSSSSRKTSYCQNTKPRDGNVPNLVYEALGVKPTDSQ